MSLLSTGTYGCSCIGGDPAAAFNRAKAVFIGQMISGSEKVSQDAIKEIKRRTHILDPQFWKTVSEGEAGNVNFAVKKVFKGNIKDEVQVEIHSDTDTGVGCGFYHLLRGEQYLVYAYGEDGDSLSSGSCTRTSSINNPATKNEDLKFLEHLPLKGSGGNIRGSIKKESAINEQLIPFTQRITVNVISADNRVIKVKSDKNGQFKAEKIKPGTYTVIPQLPKNYTLEVSDTKPFQEVKVDDLGTADAHFTAYIDGSVSGRIVSNILPKFLSIQLTAIASGQVSSGMANQNGYFKMTGIPPGQYILSFSAAIPKDTIEQFYYPGTFNTKEATPISVKFGEKIKGIAFVLSDNFQSPPDQFNTWIFYKPVSNQPVQKPDR